MIVRLGALAVLLSFVVVCLGNAQARRPDHLVPPAGKVKETKPASTNADIREGRKRLMIFGCLRYLDMLDPSTTHETRFCYWYNPAFSNLVLGGPAEYNQRT